jgi:Holliday junction resolvase
MKKINSRAKGKSAERELINLLKEMLPEELSSELTRNLDQTREGGYDILGLRGWAIEVKRYAKVDPADKVRFWEQATEQARKDGSRPVVVYREDRRDWRVILRAEDVAPDYMTGADIDYTFEMGLPMFTLVVRRGYV